jgi:hypothetical protein
LISESPNNASLPATAMSLAISGTKPPPKQKPFTMAMIGIGDRVIPSHIQPRASAEKFASSTGLSAS